MTTGYQIYKFNERYDEGFVNAGLNNWFYDLAEAKARKASLEKTWGKQGVKYIIVDCAGRKEK